MNFKTSLSLVGTCLSLSLAFANASIAEEIPNVIVPIGDGFDGFSVGSNAR